MHCPELHSSVRIRRDSYGIAHVRAEYEHDAWFAQGYVSASDRMWQMEYDRRRAVGRWSEVVGSSGLAADVLARRLQLGKAAQADVNAMVPEARAMFEAYAQGVNAYLRSGAQLPMEYELSGTTTEPWEPWHSVASYLIRHVLQGHWQLKLANAILLARIGPDRYRKLNARSPRGTSVILPPGGAFTKLYEQAVADVQAASAHLGFLAEAAPGSNSWVVHGSRTTTGFPVLCNDSHRQLDAPNVYWQAHIACPDFDVIGATFPGVPGFPHFGHNGKVGWNITHASADCQDLFIEEFSDEGRLRYRTASGWRDVVCRQEQIAIRGAATQPIDLFRTHHGPIVHGNPRDGHALALRYVATDEPRHGFEVFRTMLRAGNVAALHEAHRLWVYPANNLVSADAEGNIGYLTRAAVPMRPSAAGAHFPVPGWTGEHDWQGMVPFERLPNAINPPEGFIATANQVIVDDGEPYLSHNFSVPFRAERIVGLLRGNQQLSPETIASYQGDTTSVAAKKWVAFLHRFEPFAGAAENARRTLIAWDGNVLPGSGPALLYSCFRRVVAKALFAPVVGEANWEWLASGTLGSTPAMISHWLANVVWNLETSNTAPDGTPWTDMFPGVLAMAWADAVALGGPDPSRWRWDTVHRTDAQHTLSAIGEHLDPPSVSVGGDDDALQAASYGWERTTPDGGRPQAFAIRALSVYRQVVEFGHGVIASSIVPGGVQGSPGQPHRSDQLELWRTHQRVPMWYAEADVIAATQVQVRLEPAE